MTQLGLVCLTTTPTRLPKIGPVLRSLCKHAEVALFVPQTFLRTGEKYPEDECAKLAEINNLHIVRTPEDYGPATKVAGCLHLPDDLKSKLKSKYKRIVYVDDDQLYDVERLRALTVPPFDSINIFGRNSRVENIVYGFAGMNVSPQIAGVRAKNAPVIPEVIEGFMGVSVPSDLVTNGDLVDFVQKTKDIADFSCSDDLILSYFFTHVKKKDMILLPLMGKQIILKYGLQNDALQNQDVGHVKRYPGLWNKLLGRNQIDYIFTIGCFDKLHKGHINLLETIRQKCTNLIIGLHDNESISKIKKIKNIDAIDAYDIRKKNLKKYADDIFIIDNVDPTKAIKEYILHNLGDDKYNPNWCFYRADDNKNFPSINYIKTVMPIKFLPYTNGISSTNLRSQTNNKMGLMNFLLQTIVNVLNENNIPYYLDCGTLLGCIRENSLMEKDTDVDVTIHLSYWNILNNIDFSKYNLVRTRTLTGFPSCQDGNMISVKTNFSDFYCDIYTNPAFPKLEKRILNGREYNVPKNSCLYLQQLYGDWTIPSNRHANTAFHRGKGLVHSQYKKYWDKNFNIFECFW